MAKEKHFSGKLMAATLTAIFEHPICYEKSIYNTAAKKYVNLNDITNYYANLTTNLSASTIML